MRTWREWSILGTGLIAVVAGMLALAFPVIGEAAAPTGAISGTVTAEGGLPIEGIEVCAWSNGGEAGRCAPTAGDGSYEISALAPGMYAVEFATGEQNFAWQYYGGTRSWEATPAVPVTSGAVTHGIDAVLEAGATISGTVTAELGGLPIRGVEVCAFQHADGYYRCAITDAAGKYTIVGLTGGDWYVYFFPEQTELNVLAQAYDHKQTTTSDQPDPVALVAHGSKAGIDAALEPGGEILGTVRAAATGAPLGGVTVCLTEATITEPRACLTTGSSGAYRFYGIWTGGFKVVFSPVFGELLSEEVTEFLGVPNTPDSYPTQWWNRASTFAAATPIAVTAPASVTGIDGLLGTPPTVTSPVTTSSPASQAVAVATKPRPKTKPLECKKGLVKRKIRGKASCVKRHKAARHPRHRKRPA